MKQDWETTTIDVMTRQGVIQELSSETNDGHEMQVQPLDPGYTPLSFQWVLLNFAFYQLCHRDVEVFLESEGYQYKGLAYPKSLAVLRRSTQTSASGGKGSRKLQKWESWSESGTVR